MWQKFKEQIPAVILTALLVIAGAFWLHQQTVLQMAARQQTEIAPLRDANDALKAASEENRKQIESTNKLLRDAISKREADVLVGVGVLTAGLAPVIRSFMLCHEQLVH